MTSNNTNTNTTSTSTVPAWSSGPNGDGMPFADFYRKARAKYRALDDEFGPWVGFPEFERCLRSFKTPEDPFDAVVVKWSEDFGKTTRTWRLTRNGTETVDGEKVSG